MDARLEVRTVEERLRAISRPRRRPGRRGRGRAPGHRAGRGPERAPRRAKRRWPGRGRDGRRLRAWPRSSCRCRLADAERQAAELASQGAGRGSRRSGPRSGSCPRSSTRWWTARTAPRSPAPPGGCGWSRSPRGPSRSTRVDAETLVAEYGPGVPVPSPARTTLPRPYDRAEQERRAQAAQRQLDQLGKVNPLALEEFAALEERHAFLVTQLEDLKKTRRDLLTVIKEVDDRVQQVFAAAYEDTAREFEQIFGRLFPGGEGRLVLTEPDDMLATGIEFEARPPGKKVKRLSLLSGGERALTAIAFLVAIFKARPSPFYVMDEVEAALDDTNLQRLLQIFDELRETSQLIIVTHQKRTMEIADSLYGISMRGDGVSNVVSQRLRERERA